MEKSDFKDFVVNIAVALIVAFIPSLFMEILVPEERYFMSLVFLIIYSSMFQKWGS